MGVVSSMVLEMAIVYLGGLIVVSMFEVLWEKRNMRVFSREPCAAADAVYDIKKLPWKWYALASMFLFALVWPCGYSSGLSGLIIIGVVEISVSGECIYEKFYVNEFEW
ncbi:transmembrane protein, putative [Medicago truncatula]|uniref:Transmembrane protein, putative n=1 Tax=Medicago truncatula TaxID=3880 RepID=A0A072U7V3_MEDTR|nr:transmembrane protein, putative [Medicago truncatula]